MGDRLIQRKVRREPLPIREGLNPTRARLPEDHVPISAWEWLTHLIDTQRHRHPEDDEAALQARFDAGEVVRATGVPLSPTSLLAPGQDVWFYRIPAPEEPVPGQIEILYEDENLLVVDKPHFLATMPRARHITETATVRMRRATGNNDLAPAHRLDRPTAGVLLFTKRREVRGAYQELFARREVSKVYEAIADFDDTLSFPVTWKDRMEKKPGELQARFTDGEINAITTVARVQMLDDAAQSALEAIHGPIRRQAVYELRPWSGRTHQLRMHMWKAGLPLLGDLVYPDVLPLDAEDLTAPMRLLARSLAFTDPLDGTDREFSTTRTWFH
ncbi:pseudouridine synthase [Corynebacterium guangdongense]|nr:pseudouridine synthase [Corynebacterium guangdongense]